MQRLTNSIWRSVSLRVFVTGFITIFASVFQLAHSSVAEPSSRQLQRSSGISAGLAATGVVVRLLHESPSARYEMWEGLTLSVTDSSLPESKTVQQILLKYRAHVKAIHPTVDPYWLIQRQRAIYETAYGTDRKKNRILVLFDFILGKNAGHVTSTSLIEAMLLGRLMELNRDLTPRSEFHAFILRQGSSSDSPIRVYVGFGIKTDGVAPSSDIFAAKVRTDMKNGWQVTEQVHSHPFMYQRNKGADWGGAILPSAFDVYAYRQLKNRFAVKTFRITNGFHTMAIGHHELKKFPPGLFNWPPTP